MKNIELPDLTYNLGSRSIFVRESLCEILFPYGSAVSNIKTGKKYFYCRILINSTNDNDGQVMVLYKNEYNDYFVREINEFCDKFTAIISESDI